MASGHLSRAIIVDCDVHQQVRHPCWPTPEITTFSMRRVELPTPQRGQRRGRPLPDGTDDDVYLTLLNEHLDRLLNPDTPCQTWSCTNVAWMSWPRTNSTVGADNARMPRTHALVLNRCANLGVPVAPWVVATS